MFVSSWMFAQWSFIVMRTRDSLFPTAKGISMDKQILIQVRSQSIQYDFLPSLPLRPEDSSFPFRYIAHLLSTTLDSSFLFLFSLLETLQNASTLSPPERCCCCYGMLPIFVSLYVVPPTFRHFFFPFSASSTWITFFSIFLFKAIVDQKKRNFLERDSLDSQYYYYYSLAFLLKEKKVLPHSKWLFLKLQKELN